MRKGTKSKIKFEWPVYWRGLLMGTADLIPGVSGGTMALITGIYERLLRALSAFNRKALRLLSRREIGRLWDHVDGNFLLSLFAGILTAVFLLSKLIHYLLSTYPVAVWSFFAGLILASAFMILGQTERKNTGTWAALAAGVMLAWWITGRLPAGGSSSWVYIFISGAAASMAMILPGISGSYILVILGSYLLILEAVHRLQWGRLLVFTAGVAVGLVMFSGFLKWLFEKYRDYTLALMSGFLLGSLRQLWPWKITEYLTTNGKQIPVRIRYVWPDAYPGDPHTGWAIAMFLTGILVIILFEKMRRRHG
ncbi:MAG: DUF368 domain-containing protein [Chlorobi bacterium]|nr:DUF368 domain-containing protein [Chlorobiota bacterium]